MDIESCVGVKTLELSVGCQLQHPIYSVRGVLLVAKGSTFTRAIQRLLMKRKIEDVHIHQDDLEAALRPPADSSNRPVLPLDSELAERIDETISSGQFCCENTGPPVRSSMVEHGQEAYGPEARKRAIAERCESSAKLNAMMRQAASGGEVDGGEVMRLTAASLGSMIEDSENVLAVVCEGDDKGMSEQALQTAMLAMAMGVEMGLDAENVRVLGTTGLVAEWGVMRMPEDIRGVKRQLTENERFEIQKVPTFTANMLQKTFGLPNLVLPLAYQIHEKLDGTGYPKGRDAAATHPFAKILHVADLYTGIVSPGPGRQSAMPYVAMEIVLREASVRSIDANAARGLLRALGLFPIGSYLALSDGSVARVLRRNGDRYTDPVVRLVIDQSGEQVLAEEDQFIFVPSERGVEIARALPAPGGNELCTTPAAQLTV